MLYQATYKRVIIENNVQRETDYKDMKVVIFANSLQDAIEKIEKAISIRNKEYKEIVRNNESYRFKYVLQEDVSECDVVFFEKGFDERISIITC